MSGEVSRLSEALASHPAIKVRRRACFQCPIGCTRDTELLDECGAVVDRGEGPEFETVAMFGANLDIYDLEPITEANYLCNRLGLDTISAGGTIAALMDIYGVARATPPDARSAGERALMADAAEFARACGAAAADGPDGGTFAPAFENARAPVPLVGAMARGEGALGRALASKVQRLAGRYGSPDAAMAVKGVEIPAYDPRVTWTQALSYMMKARGGCHLQGGLLRPDRVLRRVRRVPRDQVGGRGAADRPAHARHRPRDHADGRQQHPQREPRPSCPSTARGRGSSGACRPGRTASRSVRRRWKRASRAISRSRRPRS
jgi:aldehyde:ferredoxin oxidoreductase